MLHERTRICARQDVVLREEEEGAFLFDPNTGRICYMNDLGVTLWRLCATSSTPEALIERLCSDYPEVPQEQIAKDCMKFLDDLEGLGCLSMARE
jgi:hypothetical protein